MNRKSEPWYDRAFGAHYPQVYAHRNAMAAEEEVRFAIRVTPIQRGDRILDLACGGGRHLAALQALGYTEAFGMDRSRELLRGSIARGRLVRGDLRRLPFDTGSFDVVTSFFTSFGYFDTEVEDRSVLSEVVRISRPKGRFFMDYLDAPWVRRSLIPRTERRSGDLDILEVRRLDGTRVVKTVTIRSSRGELETYEESVRLYDPEEMIEHCRDVGLRPVSTFGDMSGSPAGNGPRWILVAERGGS